MKKYKVYWSFGEYCTNGIRITVNEADDPSDFYSDNKEYTFIKEIELPEINKDDIQKKAVDDIDGRILQKNMELEGLRDKRQQLLAITHQECAK